MKKLIFGSLLALSMIALTVGATANEGANDTPTAKCGQGKCGGSTTTKCGNGKCGGDNNESTSKCGTGKCGGK